MKTTTAPSGLLLINLGTPDGPDPASVRRYLREFLSDPRVVDLNPVARSLLLNLVILPFRPRKAAQAYELVWTDAGSPLLVHSLALRDRVRERLGASWRVELGMRYGRPSIRQALESLVAQGVGRLVVLPLYPQQAQSTTGSSIAHVYELAANMTNVPPLEVLAPFHDAPGFIDAFAREGRPVIERLRADHVLFSFHGVPERHVERSHAPGTNCESEACAERWGEANRHCYRAQSYRTARLIAEALELGAGGWSVSFQSRLGRTPWLTPYTDVVVPELAARGVRRLAVYSPSFVADCLETLEEIAIRAREQFLSAGGEELALVPSLNASEAWVEAVARLVPRV